MKKPVIGILGSTCIRNSIGGTVASAFVNEAYCRGIILNGGIPFIIPSMIKREDLPRLIDMCDGLLFPGGDDVDPHLYGEEIHMLCGVVNRQEDELWIEAEHIAENRNLPVLGICRGMQLVNVARGGSLYQDLSEFRCEHLLHKQQQERDYLIHEVSIREDSLLGKVLGTERIFTNTMHHQCVKKAAEDLIVSACTSDSIPEAMESKDGRIILVQWHPEELLFSEPRMNKLFGWLVDKAIAKNNSITL